MIARWDAGRTTVDYLVGRGELERVRADRALAQALVEQSKRHIEGARVTLDVDPVGSLQLAYDASRKALVGILENQGLRPTTSGGHLVVETALRAQLVPPMKSELDDFGWVRGMRNSSQYPTPDSPSAETDDAAAAIAIAERHVAMAEKLIDQMPIY